MSRNAGRIAAEAGLSKLAIAMGVSLFGGCVDSDSEVPLGWKSDLPLGLRTGVARDEKL